MPDEGSHKDNSDVRELIAVCGSKNPRRVVLSECEA